MLVIGDAPWDVKVSAELGIPMVGVGRRFEQLSELGVRFTFRDYSEPDKIISALHAISAECLDRCKGARA